ncbi:hypothetical protein DXK91_08750 [Parageobacillus toebii]|uniref:hypothetical protein n=1 Tax=Geobacillus sp. AYS3 TaxID=2603623 RepID=UPI000BE67985|nr:hypothetical protein [Geobacillus sp. AYS3]PDM40887.1 hypothetical protein CN643_10975 [Parageobacillus yumthangensis]RDV22391.1 hypothetical protein DXK91_08750 [Parageobacillus toebii]
MPVHGEREPIPEEKEDVYLNDSTSIFSKKQKILAERRAIDCEKDDQTPYGRSRNVSQRNTHSFWFTIPFAFKKLDISKCNEDKDLSRPWKVGEDLFMVFQPKTFASTLLLLEEMEALISIPPFL